jgi:hypothetical protein
VRAWWSMSPPLAAPTPLSVCVFICSSRPSREFCVKISHWCQQALVDTRCRDVDLRAPVFVCVPAADATSRAHIAAQHRNRPEKGVPTP